MANTTTNKPQNTGNASNVSNATQQAKGAVSTGIEKAKDALHTGTEKAKDAAQSGYDTVKDYASSGVEKVRDAASAGIDRAKDFASSTAHSAGDMAENATGRVGSGMESLAGTIRSNAPHEGMVGSAATMAADTLERGGRYLREEGLSGIADDLTGSIRRNPLQAVLIGVAVGFLLARATRS